MLNNFYVSIEGREISFDIDFLREYPVKAHHSEELPFIQQLLKEVLGNSPLRSESCDTLRGRLSRHPAVSYVKVSQQWQARIGRHSRALNFDHSSGSRGCMDFYKTKESQSMKMETPHKKVAIDFVSKLPRVEGSIDLSQLEKITGGGTHDIYRFPNHPEQLLKVMKGVTGQDRDLLECRVKKLAEDYGQLYEVFGTDRCLVEVRFVDLILDEESSTSQQTIISIVNYDSCFNAKEKYGFNTPALEAEGAAIRDVSTYQKMNLSLMGVDGEEHSFCKEDFLCYHPQFRPLFEEMDRDESLQKVMSEFLTKFEAYYEVSNRLMDFRGKDNVLFYKEDEVWKFKVGSVIKHETGREAIRVLREIAHNPDVINTSFENFTLICYVPSWVRALNAGAKQVGIERRIVKDIVVNAEECDRLAIIYKKLPLKQQVAGMAEHDIIQALRLYREYDRSAASEGSDDTWLRDRLAICYWESIKEKPELSRAEEAKEFLDLLQDKRNEFPQWRLPEVQTVITGLQSRITR